MFSSLEENLSTFAQKKKPIVKVQVKPKVAQDNIDLNALLASFSQNKKKTVQSNEMDLLSSFLSSHSNSKSKDSNESDVALPARPQRQEKLNKASKPVSQVRVNTAEPKSESEGINTMSLSEIEKQLNLLKSLQLKNN